VERLPGLGCHAEGQRGEVGVIGRGAVKARMRPSVIVEVEVAPDRRARLGSGVVGFEIHLLVLDAAPQPLDEDIVPPGALAVHADRNAVAGEHAGEGLAGELRALVGVEDVRLAATSRILETAVRPGL
jgi:hypothetical protein